MSETRDQIARLAQAAAPLLAAHGLTPAEACRLLLEHVARGDPGTLAWLAWARAPLPRRPTLQEALARAQALADAMGPSDPDFDQKRFFDAMWGDA